MKKQFEQEQVADMLSEILSETPSENLLFMDYSMDVASRIVEILAEKGLKQKDLAQLMGKTEPEISKWLSGTHNFTLRSLAKIESILGKPLFTVNSSHHALTLM